MTSITQQLLIWYDKHKRDLPWRSEPSSYHIWLSEVILQQTRVDQGHAYYLRFIDRWPDVHQLAAASEQEVLKMWQGLGYYSRARNLLTAARQLVTSYDGVFPHKLEDIKKLKGVGDYTAAAIASIAFNQPVPVVDGNVFRVLSRLFAIDDPIDTSKGRKVFQEVATSLLAVERPGDYNQALMEFGALQCTPKNPDCPNCPLQNHCLAFAEKRVQDFPVKQGKIKTRKRFLNYFILAGMYQDACFTLLRYRTNGDVWQGLYDFPCIETSQSVTLAQLSQYDFFQKLDQVALQINQVGGSIKHVLTHQQLFASFYLVNCKDGFQDLENNSLSLVALSALENYPMPRLIDRFLLENKDLFENCNA
ncbi:MAG: A/G-specific adenine glycosylase [Bacteroidetes bacterium]|nr:A/G-specific adenine glycosylase [Bacteroidota bacterium]MBU1580354.1 A/G-specific adenine glycosylase [Bacteroidota bacterium]MBU2557871.1 A/G-specific adenine glycosylase [Bacteroidota bacterium]